MNKPKVRRYKLDDTGRGMFAYEDGEWVLFSDFESEAAEVERYKRENYEDRIVDLLKVRERILLRAEAAEATAERERERAEKLLKQAAEWEGLALERFVRIEALEGCLRGFLAEFIVYNKADKRLCDRARALLTPSASGEEKKHER